LRKLYILRGTGSHPGPRDGSRLFDSRPDACAAHEAGGRYGGPARGKFAGRERLRQTPRQWPLTGRFHGETDRQLLVADSTGGCNTLDAIAAEGVLQMKQRPRIYYSASQRALIWERWRKGETLHQIARLFDRYHSSIQGILAESGGIRPTERRRSRSGLTLIEREEISRGIVASKSIRAIAAALGRAPSTISREIRRNDGPQGYRAS
jgi:Helix-turn-helix domain